MGFGVNSCETCYDLQKYIDFGSKDENLLSASCSIDFEKMFACLRRNSPGPL